MWLELFNSLSISFVATELQLGPVLSKSFGASPSKSKWSQDKLVAAKVVSLVALIVNLGCWIGRFHFPDVGLHVDDSTWNVFSSHRIGIAAVGFGAICILDLKRMRPDLPAKTIGYILLESSAKAIGVYPVVAICIAIAFTMVSFVTDSFKVPHEYLNSTVYYGVFYGPYFSVHYFAKRDAIKRPSPTVLPM
eukprot:m.64933 g.64933  ORF g.64933 m.64933 type:complete len:192 (-) comp23498_c0_seq1:246-821(-)